ncbi:hypothetical protein V1511DRAFT_497311 [Dipodascopsis uninucleata]
MKETADEVMAKLRHMKEEKLRKSKQVMAKSIDLSQSKQKPMVLSSTRNGVSEADKVMEALRRAKDQKAANKKSSLKLSDKFKIAQPSEVNEHLSESDDDLGSMESDMDDYDSETAGEDEEDNMSIASDVYDMEFKGFDDLTDLSTLNEESDDDAPLVVRFDGSKTEVMRAAPTPRDRKNFMSQKAPKSDLTLEREEAKKQNVKSKKELEEDKANLKHDVELQRLITESHILSQAYQKNGIEFLDMSFDPIGKARLKTLKSRIDTLALRSGGKFESGKKDYYSVNPQVLNDHQKEQFNKEKMPMSMRRGIVKKGSERREKYVKQAKEAGIVLPKSARERKKASSKRDRGLQVQSIGKFTKSGLQLNKNDVARITRR